MSARLESHELDGIRWLLGQILVFISLLGSYTIDLGAAVLVTGGLFLVLVITAFPFLAQAFPVFFRSVGPWLLLLVIGGDFLASGGDLLPPLFRMVVLLTLFRAIRIRTPREDLQLLLLTLFLLLLTGVLSLELTFGIQLLAYAPTAMGLLFVINLRSSLEAADGEASGGGDFYGNGWLWLLRRLRERIDRATILAGAGLFGMTMLFTLLLFMLLPRFDIGAALPFPRLQTGMSLTGFTDHVQYGDVVSILNDDSMAMRVDVRMDETPARPYWRMVVLDAYYDGGFRVSPEVARDYRSINHYRFDFDSGEKERGEGTSIWTLYLEGGISAYLPAGDTFDSLRFKNRFDLQLHDLTRVLKGRETNATTLSLRYEGLRFGGILPVSDEDLLLTGAEPVPVDTSGSGYLDEVGYPETLLAYPEGTENRRILEAALEALGAVKGGSATAFAQGLSDYLREDRGYSLESRIPGGEADALLRWVESGEPGHCELYAGAFVLISRYAGFPARLVTGYSGGDWNGYENYFMVRNRHAHAWCEIFDPERGWVRADPTPGYETDPGTVGTALAGGGLQLDRTWKAYLDSLRILWFRRVIQFDREDQTAMGETFRGIGQEGVAWFKTRAENWLSGWKEGWKTVSREGDWRGLLSQLGWGIAILLLPAALLFLGKRLRGRLARESLMRRKAGRLLARQEEAPHFLREPLQRIRFGPVESWPEDTERFLRGFTARVRKASRGRRPA
ncbi:MAG: transglutaminaseTgpA domain-containing protein [Oceanipulchritudo sp.]